MNYNAENTRIERLEKDNDNLKLNLRIVNQQRELLIALVKEVSEWDKYYSSTNLKLKAKELLRNL